MKTIKQLTYTILISAFYLFSACTSDKGPVNIPTSDDIGNVSYSKDIQPIFTANCIVCHDKNHSTGLNLKTGKSYDLLVNVISSNYAPAVRIAPYSKEKSVLWHKIIDDGVFGGKMPRIGDPLSSFEIKKIEKWIDTGTPNN